MIYIGDAFTLAMLTKPAVTLWCRRIDVAELRELLRTSRWASCIGHQDLAQALSEILGIQIPVTSDPEKERVRLNQWDVYIMAQPRPPEEPNLIFYSVDVLD